MENQNINIEEEYQKLACNNSNDFGYQFRKVNSERKVTCGILKRKKIRKASHFLIKENNSNSNISITWDNKAIEEQKDYRKKHPVDKEKLKTSISKYTSININDDNYMKGLNKVNQISGNDEIINKIFNTLNESSKQKLLKRNKSCLMLGRFKRKLNLEKFYIITEKEKLFEENLEEEQKLTLKNTLFNKINKDGGVKKIAIKKSE